MLMNKLDNWSIIIITGEAGIVFSGVCPSVSVCVCLCVSLCRKTEKTENYWTEINVIW